MALQPRLETTTSKLNVDVGDGVATLTLNNPEKLNALSMEMLLGLPPILRSLQDDGTVRAVVITGAGDRAFASGADISEFGARRNTPEARAAYDAASAAADDAWDLLDKPVIAMIRGFCIGKGLLTAAKADLRIAAVGSSFAIPAARLGLGYGYRGVEALADLVGPAYASEMLFTGRRFNAEEARESGLVSWVVPEDDLEARVAELTTSISHNAPLTVAACKVALREYRRPIQRRNITLVNEMVEACFQSADYQEGQQAFAEKRPPQFEGR